MASEQAAMRKIAKAEKKRCSRTAMTRNGRRQMRSMVSRLGALRNGLTRRAETPDRIDRTFRLVASGLVLITKHVNPVLTTVPTAN